MAELAAEQEQQHNESGLDLCEAWHHQQESKIEPIEWDKLNASINLADGFEKIFTGDR
tara:strand:+ start:269 stop:442 length:174 start_codon:yes stop_codon:yes gene_type:complete